MEASLQQEFSLESSINGELFFEIAHLPIRDNETLFQKNILKKFYIQWCLFSFNDIANKILQKSKTRGEERNINSR